MHADAPGAGRAADWAGLVGAMNAIDAPGHVQAEPTRAEAPTPIRALLDNGPFPDRSRGRCLANGRGVGAPYPPIDQQY